MMKGMGLKSPAPIQSRLKHLQEKGYISWQEGRARTLQLVDNLVKKNVPILGSIAAGGLMNPILMFLKSLIYLRHYRKKVFLHLRKWRINERCFIADGDSLMEPVLINVLSEME